MNKLVAFLLTKTGLARTLVVWICGFFIAWGIIDKDKANNVWVPELTAVVVALVGRLLEKKKDEGTKELQETVGAKADGWAGPITNMKAEGYVEAATGVPVSIRKKAPRFGGIRKG